MIFAFANEAKEWIVGNRAPRKDRAAGRDGYGGCKIHRRIRARGSAARTAPLATDKPGCIPRRQCGGGKASNCGIVPRG